MNWILQRLMEPSTWAGIAVIAATVGDNLATGAGPVGAVAGGVLAILLRDRAATPRTK